MIRPHPPSTLGGALVLAVLLWAAFALLRKAIQSTVVYLRIVRRDQARSLYKDQLDQWDELMSAVIWFNNRYPDRQLPYPKVPVPPPYAELDVQENWTDKAVHVRVIRRS